MRIIYRCTSIVFLLICVLNFILLQNKVFWGNTGITLVVSWSVSKNDMGASVANAPTARLFLRNNFLICICTEQIEDVEDTFLSPSCLALQNYDPLKSCSSFVYALWID